VSVRDRETNGRTSKTRNAFYLNGRPHKKKLRHGTKHKIQTASDYLRDARVSWRRLATARYCRSDWRRPAVATAAAKALLWFGSVSAAVSQLTSDYMRWATWHHRRYHSPDCSSSAELYQLRHSLSCVTRKEKKLKLITRSSQTTSTPFDWFIYLLTQYPEQLQCNITAGQPGTNKWTLTVAQLIHKKTNTKTQKLGY